MPLRSSPTPEGRCCSPPCRSPCSAVRRCDPHRPRRVGAAHRPKTGWMVGRLVVAILTDPGGSVLPAVDAYNNLQGELELRSSPTPEGRCCLPHLRLLARGQLRPGLRSSPTPEGRCCPSARGSVRPGSRCGCDPHRPRRVGAARFRAAQPDGLDVVAILTDPGGSVLRRGGRRARRGRPPRCDPHRPRRVGAARGTAAPVVAGAADVAILTDPGGSVLLPRRGRPAGARHRPRCDPHRPRRVGAADQPFGVAVVGSPVAILTDPGGSVLPARKAPTRASTWSSCDPHRPRRVGAARSARQGQRGRDPVAILTDPGGSVLPRPARPAGRGTGLRVAILTDPGGSVLRAAGPPTAPARRPRCDPHRPRRVGAARSPRSSRTSLAFSLRSSPTPEGRCCPTSPAGRRTGRCWSCDPHRPRRVGAARRVRRHHRHPRARRCDPHRPRRVGAAPRSAVASCRNDPSLRSSPTPEGRCCPACICIHALTDPAVAILTDPGGSVLPCGPGWGSPRRRRGCDPHRPRRVGAAVFPRARRRSGATDGCDPHRPRRVGAAARPARRQGRAAYPRCDPHRPRRVGAARAASGPSPPRSCCDPHRPRRVGAATWACWAPEVR